MPDYEITTLAERIDVDAAHAYLSNSYWSPGIPLAVLRRAIENSLCVAAFQAGRQVGFARVVSDRATFAYLADVYVLDEHRGQGLARRMVEALLGHPELEGLRRLVLVTRDAHGLYSKFGFTPLAKPALFMELHRPDVYASRGEGGG